jgi:hypothetical protein
MYAMLASWIAYLFCFPLFDLSGAPPYVWLSIIATIMGIAATAHMSANRQASRVLLFSAVGLLLAMYGFQWTHVIAGLHRAMPPDSLSQLVHFMIKAKARLVISLFEKGQTIEALQQAYWNVMPLLQMLLISMWMFVGRRDVAIDDRALGLD